MTFRTIEKDMVSVGATTGSDITTGAGRRSRSARRATILGSRFRSSRVWIYSNL